MFLVAAPCVSGFVRFRRPPRSRVCGTVRAVLPEGVNLVVSAPSDALRGGSPASADRRVARFRARRPRLQGKSLVTRRASNAGWSRRRARSSPFASRAASPRQRRAAAIDRRRSRAGWTRARRRWPRSCWSTPATPSKSRSAASPPRSIRSIASFTDLPEALLEAARFTGGKRIVAYCTGGIRCEKAALWLSAQPEVGEVVQLDGGILGYFEAVGGRHWDGELFVFDRRVSLTPALRPGSWTQEVGSRRIRPAPKRCDPVAGNPAAVAARHRSRGAGADSVRAALEHRRRRDPAPRSRRRVRTDLLALVRLRAVHHRLPDRTRGRDWLARNHRHRPAGARVRRRCGRSCSPASWSR